MQWLTIDSWIVILSSLCCISSALLGNFLILRRMSLMGDAISHAVLPGLAGAFILALWLQQLAQSQNQFWLLALIGQDARSPQIMFIGAVTVGILTTLLTRWVHRLGQVDHGAAMGVIFTSLFALGLILIEYVAHAGNVDLDPECVLYGSLEFAADDIAIQANTSGPYTPKTILGYTYPRLFLPLLLVLTANLSFILIFYKELKLSTFDPDLAKTQGIPAQLLMDILMMLVAVTTVASFEAVGSILVIGMLIIPPATAYLLTDRIGTMILLSAFISLLAAAFGHVLVLLTANVSSNVLERFNDPLIDVVEVGTASMVVVVSGVLLLIAVFFSPKQGLAFKVLQQKRLRRKIREEDILGLIYRFQESKRTHQGTTLSTLLQIPSFKATRRLLVKDLNRLVSRHYLTHEQDRYILTENGLALARKLIRSHRLWEQYLHQYLNLPSDHVHMTAEKLEHITTADMGASLEAQITSECDPHGRSIPPQNLT